MINVTKTYLPPIEEYCKYVQKAWDNVWITNNGPLVQELESKLKEYLNVKHLFFCSNGTIAIQLAIKALGITKEVVTTPFSYVATTTSILWENCKPVFADIDRASLCIDPYEIEKLITENTQAILATHVYGNPCDVFKIKNIADKYNLKVIYDGAHAFGTKLDGNSLLKFGDISTCSFHATKLFHTVEGGAIITNDDDIARKLYLYRQFGHVYDDYFDIGINAKNSELHAAMGLCILPNVDEIISTRKKISSIYKENLNFSKIVRPTNVFNINYNYAYYPVIFETEYVLKKVVKKLNNESIFPRRYFYPSLNTLPYISQNYICSVSEDISKRVLCLPLYYDLENKQVELICKLINQEL